MPGVTLLLNDFEDLGMLVHAFHERVIVDFTEALSKGDLLLGREGLVAEKDHKVLEPGGLYLPERFIIQCFGWYRPPPDWCTTAAGRSGGVKLSSPVCLQESKIAMAELLMAITVCPVTPSFAA